MPAFYRTCPVCGEKKHLSQFGRHRINHYDRTCKECRRWQAAERRSKEYALSLAPLLVRRDEDGRAIPAGTSQPR